MQEITLFQRIRKRKTGRMGCKNDLLSVKEGNEVQI